MGRGFLLGKCEVGLSRIDRVLLGDERQKSFVKAQKRGLGAAASGRGGLVGPQRWR